MRFRRSISKSNYAVREAKLEDSEFLSDLQLDYLETYQTFQMPKSPDKFRIAIGSGLINNEKILVVESHEGEFLGYIEQRRSHPYYGGLSYPFVQLYHPDRENIQVQIVKHALDLFKQSNIRYVSINFSRNIPNALRLFESLGFTDPKSIYQMWDGYIDPLPDIEIEPFEVRPVSPDDLEITYKWIKYQLDKKSPLFISKSNYASLFRAPSPFKDNWAVATLDERPIAMVAAMIDPSSNAVSIFGPYNDEAFTSVRIPLLNELLVHLRMKRIERATIFRVREFYNDEELFSTFNFDKIEDIIHMMKIL